MTWRADPGRTGAGRRDHRAPHPDQGAAAPAGDPRPAGGGGDQRHRARRRPGDRPGLPPPHRRRRQGKSARPARGDPRAAAGRWRSHPYGAVARHPERVAEGASAGPAAHAAPGARDRVSCTRSWPRSASWCPRAKEWIEANPQASVQPWDVPGYKIPGGTPSHPELRRGPARVPGEPAQAAQGRADAGASEHPGRGRRGHPGRRGHRAAHRVAVSGQPGHRADREEHDQGVLLRHAGDQLRRPPARPGTRRTGHDKVACARRRDDGRGHRVRVRPGGLGGRAQGCLAGRRRQRARRTRRLEEKALARDRTTPEKGEALLARITPTADYADLAGVRPRDRGRLRDPRRSSRRCSARSKDIVKPDALLCSNTSTLPITGLAEGVRPPARLHRPALLLPGRQDAAHRDHPGREDLGRHAGQGVRRRGRPARRPRSSSTTAAASSPAG